MKEHEPKRLKPGKRVYYFDGDQGVVMDYVVRFDEMINNYELRELGDFLEPEDLFTSKQKCKAAH